MFMRFLALVAVFVASALPAQAPSDIVAGAPAAEWVAIPADDLLVMDLKPAADGKARRIVIELMPAPFSPRHVANIRTLAAAHWWDGAAINRVQDNYVAQWGDPTGKKPLPANLRAVPASDYVVPFQALPTVAQPRWVWPDAYAKKVLFDRGWPLASDGRSVWPVHCYGMVGVGRDLAPDTGSGAELYAVIGQAPRHLDRNIALVGRVVEGMDYLSSLPRGTAEMGFYRDPGEQVPIASVRIASALPAAQQPRLEYLSTSAPSFARYVTARANRKDSFFVTPAGGLDICNVPVPVRVRKD
jgi:cyclophilin family peptidyl-prolyl cis-trans isomerase